MNSQENISDNTSSLIKLGKVREAAEKLGYYFHIKGVVVRGNKIGRALRYPTANIEPVKGQLIPGHGVYAAKVYANNEWHNAMVNVGIRPTLRFNNEIVEAHLLDFKGDLYNKEICIHFIAYIRNEAKFSCPEELKNQLDKDKNAISKILYHFPLNTDDKNHWILTVNQPL